jgi:hypothetical protein
MDNFLKRPWVKRYLRVKGLQPLPPYPPCWPYWHWITRAGAVERLTREFLILSAWRGRKTTGRAKALATHKDRITQSNRTYHE